MLSDGEFSIEIYGAGEIVPALSGFDAVQAGMIEMSHAAAYYWQGKAPVAPLFTAVPFGLNAMGIRSWVYSGDGQSLWEELYKPFGVRPLMCGNTGVQAGGWFKRRIESQKDLKGLIMRIPGLGAKVVERLGVRPLLVPGAEIITSLATGVIDATEWIGPYHDWLLGLPKVAPYYYYPGWHEPGSALELLINEKAWNALPKRFQVLLQTVARQTDIEMHAEWLKRDAEYLHKIKTETKVELISFPRDVLAALKSAALDIRQELSRANSLSKKIVDSYETFRTRYEDQQRFTEWAYEKALE